MLSLPSDCVTYRSCWSAQRKGTLTAHHLSLSLLLEGGKKVSYETQGRIVSHTDTHELDSSVNLLVGLSETIPIERSSLVFRSASLRRCYSITTFNLDMMGNILEVALMVWDCDVGTHAIKGMISRHVNI